LIDYFVSVLCLVLGGIIWYAMKTVLSLALQVCTETYPTIFTGTWYALLNSLINYGSLILILIPLVIYVSVQSSKPQGGMY